MSESISYALDQGVCYLRLAGELRHTIAGPLDNLIERLFASEPPELQAMVIDLTAATFMDSTMIGLLASIARELEEHGLPPATVFSTQPEIQQLLSCLCLDQVFTIVSQATDRALDPSLLPVPSGTDSEQHSAAIILKAHEDLVRLSDSNRAAFQPVVDLFREQLECRQG